MEYPEDYIVWDYRELELWFSYIHKGEKEIPNPHYLDLDAIQDWNDTLMNLFNKENTESIFYMEYVTDSGIDSEDPVAEVVVLIIKCKSKHYTSLKNSIKELKFKKGRSQHFFFDEENKVILNVGSCEEIGHKKAEQFCKIISEKLPEMEKFD